MNSAGRASRQHTHYLAAILNGCVAPRDGSQSWLRPATTPAVRTRSTAATKRRARG